MKLATIRTADGTRAVRVDGDAPSSSASPTSARCSPTRTGGACGGRRRAPARPSRGLDYAPLIPRPAKIVCVGLNYRTHILEMGRELPDVPDAVRQVRPGAGRRQRRHRRCPRRRGGGLGGRARRRHRRRGPARRPRAGRRAAIAGYTVLNDVTGGTGSTAPLQWLQGKTFEATTPVGPWLVTADEAGGPPRWSSPARSTASGAEGRHRRPRLRPGDLVAVHLRDHHAGARRHASPPAPPAGSATPASPPRYLARRARARDPDRGAGRVPQHLRRRGDRGDSRRDRELVVGGERHAGHRSWPGLADADFGARPAAARLEPGPRRRPRRPQRRRAGQPARPGRGQVSRRPCTRRPRPGTRRSPRRSDCRRPR